MRFQQTALLEFLAAAILVGSIAAWFTTDWWAGPVYAALARL